MPAEGALRDGTAAGFELIETLRWEPGDGFVRLDRHLQRLYASAAELGFACDPERVGSVLSAAIDGPNAALRVRLVAACETARSSASAQPYRAARRRQGLDGSAGAYQAQLRRHAAPAQDEPAAGLRRMRGPNI